MSNEQMKEFIVAFKLSEQYGTESVFRVAISALVDDGSTFCVVYLKNNGEPIKGGLRTTPKQLQILRDLGVLDIEDKESAPGVK